MLLFGYLGLIVPELRMRFGERVARGPGLSGWAFAWPGCLWAGTLGYAGWLGLPLLARALAYGCYVAVPVTVLMSGQPTSGSRRSSDPIVPDRVPRFQAARVVLAMALLLVPAAVRLLPRLPVPDVSGTDVSKYLGFGTAAWCFTVLRPTPGMGFNPRITLRGIAEALVAAGAYAALALPAGISTGFLMWAPHVDARRLLLLPVLLTVTTALAEELVFRGIVQRSIENSTRGTWWGRWAALAIASLLFGLAHLPDPRYVALATLAGAAYGLVYQRTGQLLAPVLTHALVDWLWALLLRG